MYLPRSRYSFDYTPADEADGEGAEATIGFSGENI